MCNGKGEGCGEPVGSVGGRWPDFRFAKNSIWCVVMLWRIWVFDAATGTVGVIDSSHAGRQDQ